MDWRPEAADRCRDDADRGPAGARDGPADGLRRRDHPRVLGSRSELLDLGRTSRLVTPKLLQALYLRDRGCTFPGCSRPPSSCDAQTAGTGATAADRPDQHGPAVPRHDTIVHQKGYTATVAATEVTWHVCCPAPQPPTRRSKAREADAPGGLDAPRDRHLPPCVGSDAPGRLPRGALDHLRWGLVTETSAAPSATDSRQQLLELIKAHAIVHGRVTLSSGKEADFYVDLRRITLSGQAAPLVGEVMLDLTADLEFDAVGGLTMGADPVAAAMLHAAARRGRSSSTRSWSARPRRRTACSSGSRAPPSGPPRRRGRGHLHHRRLAADRGGGRSRGRRRGRGRGRDRRPGERCAGEDRGAGPALPRGVQRRRARPRPEPRRRVGRASGGRG